MAEEHAEPGSPWAPVGILILVIGGSFLVLYMRGDLKNLKAKDFLTPSPIEIQKPTKLGRIRSRNCRWAHIP